MPNLCRNIVFKAMGNRACSLRTKHSCTKTQETLETYFSHGVILDDKRRGGTEFERKVKAQRTTQSLYCWAQTEPRMLTCRNIGKAAIPAWWLHANRASKKYGRASLGLGWGHFQIPPKRYSKQIGKPRYKEKGNINHRSNMRWCCEIFLHWLPS